MSDAAVFKPFIDAMRTNDCHVVFLSLLGAENNKWVPHKGIEDAIMASGLKYTFLRPSFFCQNLETNHLRDIVEFNELVVPAGSGKTSFIDARDIAEVASVTLLEGDKHFSKGYDLTGPESLTYSEVAALLSTVSGRQIAYNQPGLFRYIWHRYKHYADPWMFTFIQCGIYTTARLGWAGRVTDDVKLLLGRQPLSMKQYLEDFKEKWIPKSQL
jgi:uncharacterized protein YbjT (DUF2867 family)